MIRPADLAMMQAATRDLMMDRCTRLVYAPTTDSWGQPLRGPAAFVDGESFACYFEALAIHDEEQMGFQQVPDIDAHLVAPFGTVLNMTDRVRLTSRLGVAIPDNEQDVYDVLGPGVRGAADLVFRLKRAQDVMINGA